MLKIILTALILFSTQLHATPKPEHIKGIYVTAWTSGSYRLDELISLANRTEINTFVIDIKDATGKTYKRMSPKLKEKLQKVKKNNIYPIARIVVFRDPAFIRDNPTQAETDTRTGAPWRTQGKQEWVSVFSKKAWDHNIALAKEAIAMGFTEIQWDYIRFPDVPVSQRKHLHYPYMGDKSRVNGVTAFLKYARKQLPNVRMTADIFGYVAINKSDLVIGQQWEEILPLVDAVHPMTYPSHYHKGEFGFPNPNARPYEVIKRTMRYAVTRTPNQEDKIIPWLQAFSIGKPVYSNWHIKRQIQGAKDMGIHQYILWNPRNKYKL